MKGIALSTPVGNTEPDFEALAPFVEQSLKVLLEDSTHKLFNINIPVFPIGIQWTKQSVRLYDGLVTPGIDPLGRKHYWFTVKPLEPAEEGTDRWAVENGNISITPLRLDLTDNEELNARLQNELLL
jgi:5'-nucleotidase